MSDILKKSKIQKFLEQILQFWEKEKLGNHLFLFKHLNGKNWIKTVKDIEI